VSSIKNKWKTGDVEGAAASEVDTAKAEELEALKKGGNIKGRFQPPSDNGDVQKCYDRSELDTAGFPFILYEYHCRQLKLFFKRLAMPGRHSSRAPPTKVPKQNRLLPVN
jgi:hypothetical protein